MIVLVKAMFFVSIGNIILPLTHREICFDRSGRKTGFDKQFSSVHGKMQNSVTSYRSKQFDSYEQNFQLENLCRKHADLLCPGLFGDP